MIIRAKFSVAAIMPCFNNPEMVERALKSIINQTVSVNEVIIIDDGSNQTDKSKIKKIISSYLSDLPISYIDLEKNVGPGKARQIGINSSVSDFVAFLDSDEYWHPKKIEFCRDVIVKHCCEIIGHNRIKIGKIEEYEIECNDFYSKKLTSWRFLVHNPIPTSSLVARRHLCENIFEFGGRRAEDYAALLILRNRASSIFFLNCDLVASFKFPFAESGAGSDVVQMKLSAIKNVFRLWRANYLSACELLIISIFWAAKFPVILFRASVFMLIQRYSS